MKFWFAKNVNISGEILKQGRFVAQNVTAEKSLFQKDLIKI
jgi:hypothetical protein